MAIRRINSNGVWEYRYVAPSKNELYNLVSELADTFAVLISTNQDLNLSDINVDAKRLAELIVRIDKRKDYYKIFHTGTRINEQKEAALLAYWIVKLKPFQVKDSVDKKIKERNAEINEVFAIFIVMSTVNALAKQQGKKYIPKSGFICKLAYAFLYWDLSKESIMLTLEAYCEGII